MFSFKSRLINATLAATAVIPLATAGTFTFAASAQAAALTGEFQFQGGFTANPSATSLITLSKDKLNFTPQPITPIGITANTGSFGAFNTGNIGNIISFASDIADNPFMDFGNLNIPGVILPGENTTSITDGFNTFSLESADYSIAQSGANVAIDVQLWGFFTSATGEKSKGAGNLTFQVNNQTVTQVNSTLASGGSISNLSFSGGAFATVPEPTTLLGLSAIGIIMGVSRRRKTQVSS
ncbi:PEP-CTERM sorting domain-containing protein [Tolypothrix sp. FACHB-123]|uniref:PEP-CTERM sorting domain-containing protein n=1 Tax=Tolypothrix sp. FACHB-123 TaxID=2692868 RepID=UPI00168210DD|nr:PEP-CTERM sorting domain-containing protein [Tolypothrix sp. FACHB-123]MBD2354121.1 PEP-CTERM sorting domain-containing protein [Tolypothrix sp. FACHB-123]